MTASYVSAGTAGTGTTSAAPTYPASVVSGDLVVACVGYKPYNGAPTNANTTLLGTATDGTTANGNGTGSTGASAFYRQAAGSLSGSETFAVTSGSPTMAQMLRFTKDSTESWDVKTYPLADTDATGTGVSATRSSSPYSQLVASTGAATGAAVRWQSFTALPGGTPSTLTVRLLWTGIGITGTITFQVADASTGGTVLASGTLNAASVTSTATDYPITLTGSGSMTAGGVYYIRIDGTATSVPANLNIRVTSGDPYGGGAFSIAGSDLYGSLTVTSADYGIASGDILTIAATINDDVPTHTSQSVTVAGCTLGTVTWLTKITTTTGNDGGMYIGTVSVTAGTATGPPVYTATSSVSGNSTTSVTATRVRAVPPPTVTQAAYRFYADGTETGATALAAQDTAPAVDTSGGDVNLALRMRLQETNTSAALPTDDWQLQWEKNTSGTWTDVAFPVVLLDQYPETNASSTEEITNTISRVAQSFLGNGQRLARASFWLNRVGSPGGSFTATLYGHTGTFGSAGVVAVSPLAASTTTLSGNAFPLTAGWVDFDFDQTYTLTDSQPYFIALRSIGSSTNVFAATDTTTPSHAGQYAYYTSVYTVTSATDLIFRVYTDADPDTAVPYASANLTDAATTTNRLTGGTGTFTAGKVSEDGLVDDLGWAQANHTELLYSLTVKSADVTNGDTLRFRVLRNGATTGLTFTAVPTLTIGGGGAYTKTASVSSAGAVTATAVVDRSTTATVSSAGAVTSTGAVAGAGVTSTATVTSTASTTTTGVVGTPSTASTSSTGQVTTTGVRGLVGAVAVASLGAIAATGLVAQTTTGSVSSTGSVSATAVVGRASTASVSSAGSVTATGVVVSGLSTTASATSAGSVSASGVAGTQSTASASSPGAVTATGVVGRTSTATVTSAGSVTSTGSTTANLTGTASATSAAQVAATGVVARTSTASVTSAGSVTGTASVVAGSDVTASVSSPATVTATAVRSLTGAADVTGTGSVTATGVVGRTSTASVSSAGAVSASGVVARSSSATVTSAGSVTAEASKGTFTTATVSSAGAVTATGYATAAGQSVGIVASPANVTATALVARSTTASATSAGTVTATGVVARSTTASVSSAGTIAATGAAVTNRTATATVTSAGGTSATATRGVTSTASVSSPAAVTTSTSLAADYTGTASATSTAAVAATSSLGTFRTATVTGTGTVSATSALGYTGTASVGSSAAVSATAVVIDVNAFRDVDFISLTEYPRQVTVTEYDRRVTLTEYDAPVTLAEYDSPVTVTSVTEYPRTVTVTQGEPVNLKRGGREYYTLGIVTDPEVTSWDATFDRGETWVTGTPATITVDAVETDVHQWLVAGPEAPDDATPVAAVITSSVSPDVRATDNPEVIIRDAKRIYLSA